MATALDLYLLDSALQAFDWTPVAESVVPLLRARAYPLENVSPSTIRARVLQCLNAGVAAIITPQAIAADQAALLPPG